MPKQDAVYNTALAVRPSTQAVTKTIGEWFDQLLAVVGYVHPNHSGDITSVADGATTLATVNANVGSFGLATSVAQFTVNAKGLVTAAANVAIAFPATLPHPEVMSRVSLRF